ncbi:MAG: hypothetical protein HYY40_10730 [Bacteroidetes bacterium]|nr:hypothetical protein [Bacteroidota bacterium]
MKSLKRNIIIGSIIFAVVYLIMSIQSHFEKKESYKEYIQLSYYRKIEDIIYIEGHRGLPDIYSNNKWYPLHLYEANIMHYIQIGDSLAKDSGSVEIKVYRKDENGDRAVKIFKSYNPLNRF